MSIYLDWFKRGLRIEKLEVEKDELLKEKSYSFHQEVREEVKPINRGYWSECPVCGYKFIWNGGSKGVHDSKPSNFCSDCGVRLFN